MQFEFISGYNCQSHYKVVAYGQPDHGKRLSLWSVAPELDGPPKLNYTPEDFKRYIIDVVGYLHWEYDATRPLPLDIARQFNSESQRQHDAFLARLRTKYPDDPWRPAPPYLVKGTAHLVPVGEYLDSDGDKHIVYQWEKQNLD